MRPGEILFGEGAIRLNAGRPTAEVTVTNTSDHTIFVSSHFPFFEVNRRLVFDRSRAWGMHLDSPRGRLRALAPRRDADGPAGGVRRPAGRARLQPAHRRSGHARTGSPRAWRGPRSGATGTARPARRRTPMAGELSRPEYAARYGPTAGDRVRLGDTDLLALIERDESSYGDEVLRGWAKTLRTGIMMSAELPAASELDLLVSNVIVMDPVLGVFKANIGVKDGVIVGIGRAGNPDVVDNPDLLIGSNTAPVYGQGYIATPGGIDTHVHLVQPRLIPAALAAGMTTLITGGLNDNPAFNLRADVPRVRGLPGEPGRAGPGGQLHGRPARAPDRVGRVRAQGARGLRGLSEHRRPGAHRRRRLRRPDRDAHRRHQRVLRAPRDGRRHRRAEHPRLPRGGHRRRATRRTSWRSPASATSSARPRRRPSPMAATSSPSTTR